MSDIPRAYEPQFRTWKVMDIFAAAQGVPRNEFIASYSAFLRAHKYEAVSKPKIKGRYVDILQSMGVRTVRNYKHHLRYGQVHVCDIVLLSLYLDFAAYIYRLSDHGQDLVLTYAINTTAPQALRLVYTGKALSFQLELTVALRQPMAPAVRQAQPQDYSAARKRTRVNNALTNPDNPFSHHQILGKPTYDAIDFS